YLTLNIRFNEISISLSNFSDNEITFCCRFPYLKALAIFNCIQERLYPNITYKTEGISPNTYTFTFKVGINRINPSSMLEQLEEKLSRLIVDEQGLSRKNKKMPRERSTKIIDMDQ